MPLSKNELQMYSNVWMSQTVRMIASSFSNDDDDDVMEDVETKKVRKTPLVLVLGSFPTWGRIVIPQRCKMETHFLPPASFL